LALLARAIPKAVDSEDEVRFDDNLKTGTDETEETGLLVFVPGIMGALTYRTPCSSVLLTKKELFFLSSY
jgi:hypothetical protein